MMNRMEVQLTSNPGGRILTNIGVWSPDGKWIAYDTRSDAAGDLFDGTRIEAVHVDTKETRVLYESKNGANCGVVTWHPKEPKVVFTRKRAMERDLQVAFRGDQRLAAIRIQDVLDDVVAIVV